MKDEDVTSISRLKGFRRLPFSLKGQPGVIKASKKWVHKTLALWLCKQVLQLNLIGSH